MPFLNQPTPQPRKKAGKPSLRPAPLLPRRRGDEPAPRWFPKPPDG
jgi:hypothetical protein